ncbi:hypothetical protein Sa4125_44390 [Aureimonas sp. SA4125]|uniref:putative bifunctional diguanylate cyclase/phosphodiesterase n=1 Tax=Aureimonas sp. SA4125 TaxID=2826993 RepID=UPI001CC46DFE|nr:EAL domain-containing protein [Aureimonas sp. SA4125]BDA86897.1 hypothetical protein Sa4125_44390 [Aureimonas sp. SA4125]
MSFTPDIPLYDLQSEVLEAIATGMELKDVALLLCQRAEALAPDAVCTILSVDEAGLLRLQAAPSLPEDYARSANGTAIGEGVGSCGTAAFRGTPVEVTDIATDPLWTLYRDDVLPLGLKACWSSPIVEPDGRVVAIFAFYYRTRRGPTDLERHIVKTCVHLCRIAAASATMQRDNRRLAYYDQLTNLRNRRSFDQNAAAILDVNEPAFGMLLADIDHLKTVNDTLGHGAGDRLICEVAERLKQAGGTTYRIGGDEFVLLIPGCRDAGTLEAVANKAIESMAVPFSCEGGEMVPSVTIGGVVYGVDGTDLETLRQNADFALYHAKGRRRGGYVCFEQSMRTARIQRSETIAQVERALAENRIVTYYQPLVRLDTGAIVGVEALARLRTPSGDILTAGAFHAAFSDPIVSMRLTDVMLAQVARDIRTWLDNDVPFRHVSINLAMADFQRGDLDRRLTAAFARQSVSLEHLVLEVTESVFMDGADNDVARAVERLRGKGMLVALDDFGTGFASLTHLLTFPVDIIKIDKSFVDRLLTDRPSRAIVEALIDIARKLGMNTVAEGVEDAAQADVLRGMGCLLGQGYHFARPADAKTTSQLLSLFARTPGSAARPGGSPARLMHAIGDAAAAIRPDWC